MHPCSAHYVTRRSITQACLRPLGCIGGFCRAIKVQWPKTNGQDPKQIKVAWRVLDSMNLKLKGYFRLRHPTGMNPCLNRTNGPLIFEIIVKILSRLCKRTTKELRKVSLGPEERWLEAEPDAWSTSGHGTETVRAHPLTRVPYSFLRSFHSFVQRWWYKMIMRM